MNEIGILGNNAPSTETSASQFDLITNINYRGTWLCSRAEISQMQKQEPLEGKSTRGAVVNIASQLGLVGRRDARKFFLVYEREGERAGRGGGMGRG